jgi:predicted phage terminase large subunit-like protein
MSSPDTRRLDLVRPILIQTVEQNKYINQNLVFDNPKQILFLSYMCREALYGGSVGGGKALTTDTLIPTPSGWTTMGALKAGDVIFGKDGKPCRVLIAHPVNPNPETFRLSFDDGTEIMASADHNWLTFSLKELGDLLKKTPEWRAKRRARRASRSNVGAGKKWNHTLAHRLALSQRCVEWNKAHAAPGGLPSSGSIRSTRDIFETLKVHGRTNHAIPVCAPLDMPEAILPLDPYLLGLWLGHGDSDGGGYTTSDPELLEAFRRAGFTVTTHLSKYHYGILGLVTVLRNMGLHKNKHIPAEYLRASKAQRLALLQGLMDTDGTVYKQSGSVEFNNCNRALASGVRELIVSLGWKCRMIEGRAILTRNGIRKDCGPKWDIKWTPGEYVFRLERKRNRQRLATRQTVKFRYVIGCEPAAPVPMRCITVGSPDGLFLCHQNMVPTHNSAALLAAALQFVHVPDYSAILFRSSLQDLEQPGALMDRSHKWLDKTDARWNPGTHMWRFPSGATLKFGYLDKKGTEKQFKSAEFQFVGFDELTEFVEYFFTFMFSRLRKNDNMPVPIRMRAASNPGGPGHEWVRRRFIENTYNEETKEYRIFIRAGLKDNPHLDQKDYLASLSNLDPITRDQLIRGDWNARSGYGIFKREWFSRFINEKPRSCTNWVRAWDLAATEPEDGKDPDYSCGVLIGLHHGQVIVADIQRFRGTPRVIDVRMKQCSIQDGHSVRIRIEKEKGASGISVIDRYARFVLPGYDVAEMDPIGDAHVLAGPFSSAAEAGNVIFVKGRWHGAFLDELEAFPTGRHDDQIKAACLGLRELASQTSLTNIWTPKTMPETSLPVM